MKIINIINLFKQLCLHSENNDLYSVFRQVYCATNRHFNCLFIDVLNHFYILTNYRETQINYNRVITRNPNKFLLKITELIRQLSTPTGVSGQ